MPVRTDDMDEARPEMGADEYAAGAPMCVAGKHPALLRAREAPGGRPGRRQMPGRLVIERYGEAWAGRQVDRPPARIPPALAIGGTAGHSLARILTLRGNLST